MIFTVGQFHALHARGQFQIRDMDVVAHFQVGHIHFDIFRQILGQAGNFQVDQAVGNHAAFHFYTDALVFIDKVDGHVHGDFVLGVDTHEVHVHETFPGRVALQILDHDLFGLAVY